MEIFTATPRYSSPTLWCVSHLSLSAKKQDDWLQVKNLKKGTINKTWFCFVWSRSDHRLKNSPNFLDATVSILTLYCNCVIKHVLMPWKTLRQMLACTAGPGLRSYGRKKVSASLRVHVSGAETGRMKWKTPQSRRLCNRLILCKTKEGGTKDFKPEESKVCEIS